jgi:hypothetical protein
MRDDEDVRPDEVWEPRSADPEAPEADVAEQAEPLVDELPPRPPSDPEAPDADVAEQLREVPLDDEDQRD